jgi:hypothetical protein
MLTLFYINKISNKKKNTNATYNSSQLNEQDQKKKKKVERVEENQIFQLYINRRLKDLFKNESTTETILNVSAKFSSIVF